jgi:mRNA interferase MazF
VERGEVWWAELPEPLGRRPVVLVSRPEAYQVRRSVAVVEVTTVTRGLATEVKLGRRDGVPRPCVANADGIHTIPLRRLMERVCKLKSERVEQIDNALRFALALDTR